MEDDQLIPASEFCRHHQVEVNFIYSLQEYGLVELVTKEHVDYFSSASLDMVEKILRLHYELNINLEGIDVVLHLLNQLNAARQEANELKNELQFYR